MLHQLLEADQYGSRTSDSESEIHRTVERGNTQDLSRNFPIAFPANFAKYILPTMVLPRQSQPDITQRLKTKGEVQVRLY
jgi:hypothetical protein